MTHLFDLSWWQLVLVALGLTHNTIAGVTIFLHRSQAHKAVELSAPVNHFFRFWLWLTTGMVTKEWVAVHRLHHAKCETEGDPHSPQVEGLNRVLWLGAWLYRKASTNQETLDTYGKGTPDDWLERKIYTPYPGMGISLMLIIDLLLFGFAGALIWVVQMAWIPFWAAGVINGIGHYFGYRNWNTTDASTNIIPLGLVIGGEELHNNHHAFASSARLSSRWYEFDIGWLYIRLMQTLRLARVKKVAPRIRVRKDIRLVDLDTVSAVLGNRLQVFSNYAKQVVKPVAKSELCSSRRACREKYKAVRGLLADSQRLDEAARQRLQKLLEESQLLETVYQFQEGLSALWERTATSQEARREALQEWVVQAEAAGIDALSRFARQLRGYSVTST
ncbi:DesA family fatty acid desaturase [Solemya velum gill symbiont]|uniref:DesA family fatty acid desaturase n=1 Tax=Solemya velum gill symbiont TaxID=2340 RepID=UPI0009961D01|nr:fatty acid desaturase [Solemya velum gill symbiont]OOZ43834.1 acyl-CoA desaturase [Solemya velum gill symbiont]OOZ45938.1 acyl-CoA desaturase [Solemya velum gill symbiont]OOZ48643.1 acyl-CoA desaturase [Solemya velum gill symbiont]OOZ50989.1 acyl-CoA desaturase [Solemya velum gill symbiont]OOZ53682.1 acyl-CoA desaturase [Solemya velum gill symbiont]